MNNMPQRLVFFALGVVINSFGVALITLGNLGTSVISSVPYVCSLQFPMFSFGVTTFIWNILLILVQVVLLRRDFKPSQFLQIMVNVLFSAMIDVSMAILGVLHPHHAVGAVPVHRLRLRGVGLRHRHRAGAERGGARRRRGPCHR